MRPVTELKGVLRGRVCVVLGAGPSTISGLKSVPEGAYTIGSNAHFVDNCLGWPVNMTVSRATEVSQYLWDKHKDSGFIRISRNKKYTDFDVGRDIIFDAGYSGTFAVGMASYMEADLILILGMDLFREDHRYFHSTEETPLSYPQNADMGQVLRPWTFIKAEMAHADRVRTIGCHEELQRLFGRYNEASN